MNTSIVSDNVVSTSNWSNFWHTFASRGFVSDSWAFLFETQCRLRWTLHCTRKNFQVIVVRQDCMSRITVKVTQGHQVFVLWLVLHRCDFWSTELLTTAIRWWNAGVRRFVRSFIHLRTRRSSLSFKKSMRTAGASAINRLRWWSLNTKMDWMPQTANVERQITEQTTTIDRSTANTPPWFTPTPRSQCHLHFVFDFNHLL